MDEQEFLAESASLGDDTIVEENQPLIEEGQEQEQEPENDPLEGLSEIEVEEYEKGWRPESEFKGAEGNWKSAKEYRSDGKWLAKLKESNQRIDQIETDFKDRLENANKLAEAKRVQDIADLKEKQYKAAFEEGDEEKYKSTQKQIDKLEAESDPVEDKQDTPNKSQEIIDWEDNNAWINDANDERSSIAMALYDSFAKQNPSGTIEQALAHVDSKINVLYPAKNPRREQPNATESPKRQNGRKGRELSMKDLTSEEQSNWNAFGRDMFTEKEYLKAVKDARVK